MAAPPASGASAARVEPAPVGFDAAYAEFFPFVWRCMKSLGIPGQGLDDACQDVFVVVHRRLPEFSGSSSLRTWIYGICRKVAFNHRRRRSRKGSDKPLVFEPPSPNPSPQEALQDTQAALFVQNFLSTLSESKREVFILSVLEQWSSPEVAEALRVPLNTVYSRLRVARLEFQAALLRRQEEHGRR